MSFLSNLKNKIKAGLIAGLVIIGSAVYFANDIKGPALNESQADSVLTSIKQVIKLGHSPVTLKYPNSLIYKSGDSLGFIVKAIQDDTGAIIRKKFYWGGVFKNKTKEYIKAWGKGWDIPDFPVPAKITKEIKTNADTCYLNEYGYPVYEKFNNFNEQPSRFTVRLGQINTKIIFIPYLDSITIITKALK